ncbi:MAG TPA: helix-turn-helix domain-containing protein [Polyangiales bacterium]|nr:helix-turn-helix domain-containing protein [Polyangiales bacterium]
MKAPRSGCPINLTLEALGDRWSLIVIRDMMFGNRRHFRELLAGSEERIASNILADRLTRLEEAGLVSRREDPTHKQKVIYSLTAASIELVPLLAVMGGWGLRHTRASKELSVRAELLEDGGPRLWSKLMKELRHLHMEAQAPKSSVFAQLQAAYEAAVAKKARRGRTARAAKRPTAERRRSKGKSR